MTLEDSILLAGFTQTLAAELADSFEHDVTLRPVSHGQLDQRASDQLCQQVNDIVLINAVAGADFAGRVVGPTARENR